MSSPRGSWLSPLLVTCFVLSTAIGNAAPATDLSVPLKKRLMESVHKMDGAHSGLFNDDITAVVAPSFPPGQPMRETLAILKREGLGNLHKFKGDYDPGAGSMFVSTTHLMVDMSSTVAVVLDFDFTGTQADRMVVRTVKAFIRSSSM